MEVANILVMILLWCKDPAIHSEKGCQERRKGGPFASDTLEVWEPVKILVLEDQDSTWGGVPYKVCVIELA